MPLSRVLDALLFHNVLHVAENIRAAELILRPPRDLVTEILRASAERAVSVVSTAIVWSEDVLVQAVENLDILFEDLIGDCNIKTFSTGVGVSFLAVEAVA